MQYLSPLTYWAQNGDYVYLKIDLVDVKDLIANFNKDHIVISCVGKGAQGVNNYKLDLTIYESIESEKCTYKIHPSHIDVVLYKSNIVLEKWWPYLLKDKRKPIWLKIDFEKWKEEEENIEEIKEDLKREFMDMKDLDEPFNDYKMADEISEKFKPNALFFYNCIIFINYFTLLIGLMLYYAKPNKDFASIYLTYGLRVFIIQLLQTCEIYFAIQKKIPTNWLFICGNVFNHLIMIQGLCFYHEPRMRSKPIIFYLYVVWCLEASLRYPYYIYKSLVKGNPTFTTHNKAPFLTWMRYTFWLPLCPLQYFIESVALLRVSRYLEDNPLIIFGSHLFRETDDFFNPYFFIRIYMFSLIIALIFAMSTVFDNRKKKYGTFVDARRKYKAKHLAAKSS